MSLRGQVSRPGAKVHTPSHTPSPRAGRRARASCGPGRPETRREISCARVQSACPGNTRACSTRSRPISGAGKWMVSHISLHSRGEPPPCSSLHVHDWRSHSVHSANNGNAKTSRHTHAHTQHGTAREWSSEHAGRERAGHDEDADAEEDQEERVLLVPERSKAVKSAALEVG